MGRVRKALPMPTPKEIRAASRRRGAAALDYVLILGVILPMIAFITWIAPRLIALTYEMVAGLIAWPFL